MVRILSSEIRQILIIRLDRVSLFEFHFSALCNFTFYRYRSAIPVIEQEVQLHFSVPYSRYGDNNLTRDSVQKSGT